MKELQKENDALKKQVHQGSTKLSNLEAKYKGILSELNNLKEKSKNSVATSSTSTATDSTPSDGNFQESLDKLVAATLAASDEVKSCKVDWDHLSSEIGAI